MQYLTAVLFDCNPLLHVIVPRTYSGFATPSCMSVTAMSTIVSAIGYSCPVSFTPCMNIESTGPFAATGGHQWMQSRDQASQQQSITARSS